MRTLRWPDCVLRSTRDLATRPCSNHSTISFVVSRSRSVPSFATGGRLRAPRRMSGRRAQRKTVGIFPGCRCPAPAHSFCMCVRVSRDLSVAAGWPMLSPAPNQRRILRIFSGGRCPAPAHIVRMCVRAKTCPLVRSRRKTTNPAPNGPVKVCPLVRHRRQTPGPAPNDRTPGPAPNCGHFSGLPMPRACS